MCQLDAPTSRMMPISRRRAYAVMRIVLETCRIAATISRADDAERCPLHLVEELEQRAEQLPQRVDVADAVHAGDLADDAVVLLRVLERHEVGLGERLRAEGLELLAAGVGLAEQRAGPLVVVAGRTDVERLDLGVLAQRLLDGVLLVVRRDAADAVVARGVLGAQVDLELEAVAEVLLGPVGLALDQQAESHQQQRDGHGDDQARSSWTCCGTGCDEFTQGASHRVS